MGGLRSRSPEHSLTSWSDQNYTGFSMAWATPDTIATIIGLVTPVLVWAIPNKKAA